MLDMLSIILGEGSSSRLYHNLIETQTSPVFNMIDAEHYLFRDGGNIFVQANFDPERKEEAIELIKQELEKFKQDITVDEFKKAKKKIESRFAYNAETVSEIGETIGYYMTVCDNLSLIEDYLDTLKNISIDDLLDAAKRFFDINNAVISVLLPEKSSN